MIINNAATIFIYSRRLLFLEQHDCLCDETEEERILPHSFQRCATFRRSWASAMGVFAKKCCCSKTWRHRRDSASFLRFLQGIRCSAPTPRLHAILYAPRFEYPTNITYVCAHGFGSPKRPFPQLSWTAMCLKSGMWSPEVNQVDCKRALPLFLWP